MSIDDMVSADRLLTGLRAGSSQVIVRTGGEESASEPLPAAALPILLEVLAHTALGNRVVLMPIEAELTTQGAAELLGVSRPHLVKLLDSGRIAHRKVGAHRRVKFSDLAAYQRAQSRPS